MGRPFLIALVVLAGAAMVDADAPPPPGDAQSIPRSLPFSAEPISLADGLAATAWPGALVFSTFFESAPNEGAQPPVRSTGYLIRDEDALYVAFHLDDPEPRLIRAPFVDRDKVVSDQDFIQFEVDVAGSERTSRLFRVNARGVQGDGVWSEAVGVDDFAPDFTFDAVAALTEGGWSAALRIPLSELQPAGGGDPWRVMLFRNWPRTYTYQMTSSLVPRGANCWLCNATPLAGTETIVAPPAVSWTPQVRAARGTDSPADGSFDAGLDVSWRPAPGVALAATLNPDFSQVESDAPQLDVNTRFALSYPEKRPFFMEGTDLLATPIRAVYTRSITAPSFGLRATGALGTLSYAVLAVRDDGGGSVVIPGATSSDAAPQDFRSDVLIGRLRWELGTTLAPGFLVTAREVEGGAFNRVVGPDLQWRPSPDHLVVAQFLGSSTREPSRPDSHPGWNGERFDSHAFLVSWAHTTPGVGWRLVGRDLGAGFRADAGFVPQVDQRGFEGSAWYRFYRVGSFTLVQPGIDLAQTLDTSGELLDQTIVARIDVQGGRGLSGGLELHARDRQRVGTDVFDSSRVVLRAALQPGRSLTWLSASVRAGTEVDVVNARLGRGARIAVEAAARPADRLTVEGDVEHGFLDTLDGARGRIFSALAARLKLTYSFTSRILARLIVQHERVRRNPRLWHDPVAEHEGSLDGSLLLTYRLDWRRALYLGFGERRVRAEDGSLQSTGRQFFLKLSYGL